MLSAVLAAVTKWYELKRPAPAGQLGMRNLCLLSAAAGGTAFCLSFLLTEEKRENLRNGITVSELLQVCRGRRIIVFSLIALIQQGIQLTTAMSFTNQILKEYGASDSIVGISSIVYMVSAVCFSALASLKFCERRELRLWGLLLQKYIIYINSDSVIPESKNKDGLAKPSASGNGI